jgi:hypothetical protein
MYLWITTHFDGAEMQREAKQAVLLAAGLATVASLGAAYAAWKLVKTTRGK